MIEMQASSSTSSHISRQYQVQSVEVQTEALLDQSSLADTTSYTSSNLLTHDAELSDLWDYYETQIQKGHIRRYKIEAKECSQRCRHYSFVYPATVIYRHPKQVEFARRLIHLGYRYCKDCCILIPKSLILELEQINESKKPVEKRKPRRTAIMPIKCPCCRLKTATVQVLIRRTKMAAILFSDEGY